MSNTKDNNKSKHRNISDFLNTEYREYAFSVLEDRAIPSVCDGLKPGARKILHASLTGTTKDGKLYKLLALSGDTMRLSLYAHGDGSLNATIVNLCKDFNDNLNPLESDSQVGTLRDPDSSGAPRYLYVRHSRYMDVYKTDTELLQYVEEEGQQVEPVTYLPIIPTVLCKHNIGVAVGYSMHNIAYNPLDVIDACLEALRSKKDINDIKKFKTIVHPYTRGIRSDSWVYADGIWMSRGSWTYDTKKDIMVITDLPVGTSYEDFEKLLIKLEEVEYIKAWKNLSEVSSIRYEITFQKKTLSKLLKDDHARNVGVPNKFKLIKETRPDLLWLLDEHHKLRYFEDAYDVIRYFVNWRLTHYTTRKERLVRILGEKYTHNSQLCKFIDLVCSGTLVIRNRSKNDVHADMKKYELPVSLLGTPMSKVTVEERNELLRENERIKGELEYIKKTSERDMYIDDLNVLKKKLSKDFC